jgi:hypothetical protein
MRHYWSCPLCDRESWSFARAPLVDFAKDHLFDAHQSTFVQNEVAVEWDCPYCEYDVYGPDRETVIGDARDHLFEHDDGGVSSDLRVSDVVESGCLLVTGGDRPATEDACVDLLTASGPAGGVVFVTADPTDQLTAWRDRIEGTPAEVSVLSPLENPLSDVEWLSPNEANVVRIEDTTDLSSLGASIADSVDPGAVPSGEVTVCIDILDDLIRGFELQTVFRFLHLLAGRIRRAGTLAHFHLDARGYPDAVTNMLTPVFGSTLAVRDEVYVNEV